MRDCFGSCMSGPVGLNVDLVNGVELCGFFTVTHRLDGS